MLQSLELPKISRYYCKGEEQVSESKFKVEFILKQHTPIIHFQSDQNGATLRATELKPKFDKFLKKFAFGDNEQKYEDFLIKGQEAFDYKVQIEQNLSKGENIDKRESLFFGNMGEGVDKKYKHHKDKFKVIFFSYNPRLIEVLKTHFESFLANTNFGTRQSKGYGGFYIADKQFDKTAISEPVYSFSSRNWEKDIKILYSFLRQGINLPNRESTRFYCKPAIFLYAKSKGWTWDKKAIKKEYFSHKLSEQSGDAVAYQSDESYILRDLFGLSSDQSWLSYGATISKENKEIERFKSPITFKKLDNIVYFWANDTTEKILEKEFKIQSNKGGDLTLSTPSEFDFDDFFYFSFNIDLSKHIESEYQNQPEYGILNRILKELKANK